MWLLATLVVITGSLLPEESLPVRTLERLPISDKLEHAALYALLAVLPAIHERRGLVIAAAAGAIALGVGLEFAQPQTGRDFEIADMIADAAGVLAGLAAGVAIRVRMSA
jgi:VanZ family protein